MSSHKTTFNFNRTAAHSNELGANYDGDGVNFALFSEVATRIELCLFDEAGNEEIWRGDLPDMAGGIWYGYLPKARPGLVYGYRVHGPYGPEAGHRCNPSKLLLDPYARHTAGELVS